MIEKKVVYCEMAFLQEFLNSYPRLEPNDESLRLVDAWMSFYLFFCKSDIILDISASEFKIQVNSNEWLFRLWKKSTENLCGLEFDSESFPDVSTIEGGNAEHKFLNAVYLTTKGDDVCKSKSQELGVFVFNPEIVKHCNHLFCDNGTAFPDDRARDWDFIRGLTGPNVAPPINISNSMLIIDNYILYDDRDLDYQEKMRYNLKPILQNLLPSKLAEGEIYEITVFVGIKSEDTNKRDLFGAQYNYLRTLIERIRKDLNFRLSVFVGNSEDKFHDRSIVTNNVLINSGHGFGILRSGGRTNSPTSINIVFPFFQTKIAWCDRSFLNVMQTANRITNRLHEPDKNCWGNHDKKNRMISYYNISMEQNTQPVITRNVEEDTHRNGRVVGKIDLSELKDFKSKNYRRF